MKKWCVWVTFVFLLMGCKRRNKDRISFDAPVIKATCKFSTVSIGPVEEYAKFYGHIIPARIVKYVAPKDGRIVKIYFGEGEVVQKGKKILELRNDELEIRLLEAKKKLEFVKLISSGVDTLNPEYLDQLATYKSYEMQKEMLTFTAPFCGVVRNLRKCEGEMVHSGEEIAELVKVDTFSVVIKLSRSDLEFVRPGSRAFVVLSEKDTVWSQLKKVFYSEDGGLEAEMSVSGSLRVPGPYVEVYVLKGAKNNALRVPKEAIIQRSDRFIVFRYSGGLALWQEVKPGIVGERFVEILSEVINPGDTVLIEGHYFLSHNTPVELMEGE
ncbi:MAG: efflux RND transporter periplasmic adaptor subunit [candidate division WOR-3 bacterium]